MICCSLVHMALPRMKGVKVEDVRIGLGYTAVKNSLGGVGLAYTFTNAGGGKGGHGGCTVLAEAGELIGMDLQELAFLFPKHDDPIRSALGLSAINSVAPSDHDRLFEGDIVDSLDIKSGDKVGMVGYFHPIAKKIREKTNNLFIIDKGKENRTTDIIQESPSLEILWDCRIVIITATTLLNKTFEETLEYSKNAEIRILMGPSTPMYYDYMKETGIQYFSGMMVKPGEEEPVLRIVSQGGGTMKFKNHCKKVNLSIL